MYELSIMTLNLAHGRGGGRHQWLQSTDSITANLRKVIDLFAEYQPDIVGLQEVDRVSAWNGRFDHFEHLATAVGFEHCIHADNVNSFGLSYGAGLLSNHKLDHQLSVTFEPAPPLPPKGFVVASIQLQGRELDLVSLHLDPASRKRRAEQAEQLIAVLKSRHRPLVVMGDFNTVYNQNEHNALRMLRKQLQLHTWKPYALGMSTFPKLGRRYDWIMLSTELIFTDYQTIKHSVSDHLPVYAKIAWQNT